MKWSEKIIRILLVTAIVVSLILSAHIWLNMGNQKVIRNTSSTTNTTQVRDEKSLLMPTSLYIHDNQSVVMKSQESVVRQVLSKLSHMDYSVVKPTSETDMAECLQQQDVSEGIEMTYTTDQVLQQFINRYQLKVKGEKPDNFKFNRIIINTSNNQLTFMQDGKQLCIMGASDSLSKLYDCILHKQSNGYKVQKLADDKLNYGLLEDTTMPIYRYVLTTESYMTFAQVFFHSTDDLASKDHDDHLILTDKQDNELMIDNRTGTVLFSGHMNQHDSAKTQMLEAMGTLGSELGKLRLYEMDGHHYVFRTFVEGFPIFASADRCAVEATVESSHNLHLQTNLQTVQVPIPSKDTTTLVKASTIADQLQQAGADSSLIQTLTIGYEWQPNSDSAEAIDLVPKWFIQDGNNWETTDQWLQQKGGQ